MLQLLSKRIARASGLFLAILICTGYFSESGLAQPDVELQYLGEFGQDASDLWEFSAPRGIVIDAQGWIVVADSGNSQIGVCDVHGDCSTFGSNGFNVGEFAGLSDVSLDSQGRIVVVEEDNNRVQFCDYQGNCEALPPQPGRFNLPFAIDVDSQDRVVVSDQLNHEVDVCTTTGNCTSFGTNEGLSPDSPPGVWGQPTALAVDNNDRVLVRGELDFIHVCNTSGQCSNKFGGSAIGPETPPGMFRLAEALEADDRGNVFVADTRNDRVQACDYNGSCVAFGDFGSGPGQFFRPVGLAIDGQARLYVVERNRIQIFQIIYGGQGEVFRINSGLNDSWFNRATIGQGFFITVFEDIRMIFLAWFTYDTERPPGDVEAILGEPGHRWLTAFGPYVGNVAALDVELTSGGIFDAAAPVPAQEIDGTISLEFDGCNAATITYDLFSAGVAGEIPIERIALDNVPICEAALTQ